MRPRELPFSSDSSARCAGSIASYDSYPVINPASSSLHNVPVSAIIRQSLLYPSIYVGRWVYQLHFARAAT